MSKWFAEYEFMRNGRVVASGTLAECAEQLGIRTNTARYVLIQSKQGGNTTITARDKKDRQPLEWSSAFREVTL